MCHIKSKFQLSVLERWGNKSPDVIKSILKSNTDSDAAMYGVTATTLAMRMNLHESTIRRRLNELKSAGQAFSYNHGTSANKWWPLGGLHQLTEYLKTST